MISNNIRMFPLALKYMSPFYSSKFYSFLPRTNYKGMIMMIIIPSYLVYNLPKGNYNIELSSGNMLPILKTNSS